MQRPFRPPATVTFVATFGGARRHACQSAASISGLKPNPEILSYYFLRPWIVTRNRSVANVRLYPCRHTMTAALQTGATAARSCVQRDEYRAADCTQSSLLNRNSC